ncbi:MAG TPA: glycerol kinase GlpK [Chthoniobacteraceae bacterium]|nr:glycerol kinase GlpK [Chthoniobacteraceae bacterium]
MKYILALDQGTTSSRAIVFDREGAICGVAQQEFRQIFPQPGWVEHDAEEIWASQHAVAAEAVQRAKITQGELAAIGITNQRETTIIWDRETGAPVYNAIVWQDRRTAAICERLASVGLATMFQEKTGLVIDPYFSGTKIKWLLDNVPEVRERADEGKLAFGTVDSWLVWKLSGGKRHVTDVSNASRTLLFNIHTGEWDHDLLAALDIPRSLLPQVVPSSEMVAATGQGTFMPGVPISGMAGDQQAALFGQACFQPGMAKNTYGTGCFMLMSTGPQVRVSGNQLLSTVAWRTGGVTEYALEGSVFIAGAVVQWLRDGLGIIKNSPDVEALAASVPDNGGVYLVPAFSGLGAPHWDPYARGSISGLTRGATAAHIARAALESIAYQSHDALKAMERDSGTTLKELRVDGGASLNNLLMQFQADLLQVPVVRPKITETTALGAAYLAGLAVGFWSGRDEIAGQWSVDRRFEPERKFSEMEKLRGEWGRAVERAKGWEHAR